MKHFFTIALAIILFSCTTQEDTIEIINEVEVSNLALDEMKNLASSAVNAKGIDNAPTEKNAFRQALDAGEWRNTYFNRQANGIRTATFKNPQNFAIVFIAGGGIDGYAMLFSPTGTKYMGHCNGVGDGFQNNLNNFNCIMDRLYEIFPKFESLTFTDPQYIVDVQTETSLPSLSPTVVGGPTYNSLENTGYFTSEEINAWVPEVVFRRTIQGGTAVTLSRTEFVISLQVGVFKVGATVSHPFDSLSTDEKEYIRYYGEDPSAHLAPEALAWKYEPYNGITGTPAWAGTPDQIIYNPIDNPKVQVEHMDGVWNSFLIFEDGTTRHNGYHSTQEGAWALGQFAVRYLL